MQGQRPWWSVRPCWRDVVDSPPGGAWAGFCVTARWGAGESLIMGFIPANHIPKSGLHALRIHDRSTDTAYLCGVLNSTMFQQLAGTMPPGQSAAPI